MNLLANQTFIFFYDPISIVIVQVYNIYIDLYDYAIVVYQVINN